MHTSCHPARTCGMVVTKCKCIGSKIDVLVKETVCKKLV